MNGRKTHGHSVFKYVKVVHVENQRNLVFDNQAVQLSQNITCASFSGQSAYVCVIIS